MGLRSRGDGYSNSNVHSGHGNRGASPFVDGQGSRAGVPVKTPGTDAHFGPSVSQGNSEDSLTTGAELRGGKGKFPRKADSL
jgi:hypothetical protein